MSTQTSPYPRYRALLANDEPIRSVHGDWVGFDVVRHDQVTHLLRDPRMIRNAPNNTWQPPEAWRPWFDMTANWMLFRDPPAHTRLRGLVGAAFTPRAIAALRGHIAVIADELLDAALARREFDLIADYAFELPVRVIADMLGVPRDDRDHFRDWSKVLAQAIDFSNDESFMNRASAVAQELDVYIRALIDEKRARPADDILSGIVHARLNDDTLSTEEVVGTVALLLFAGHETTVNLIGNGALALMRHPDQLAALRASPALIENAVEEVLRFDSPVQATTRIAGEDIAVGGVTLPQGREVTLWLGAANHDPRVFDAPERFDIARKDIKHLSFGGGIHYCIGASLARLEGQLALGRLFERAPTLRALEAEPLWRELIVLRGMEALRVAV
jgi:pimeloyl-[acyl-carrier protein] synthase